MGNPLFANDLKALFRPHPDRASGEEKFFFRPIRPESVGEKWS